MSDFFYSQVVSEINQCNLMGLEKVVKSQVIGEHRVTITKDNFNQYRVTLKHMNSRVIVSGILYDQFRIVKSKFTVQGSRGNGYTKQLHAYIQSIVKRKFYHSDNMTIAGKASA